MGQGSWQGHLGHNLWLPEVPTSLPWEGQMFLVCPHAASASLWAALIVTKAVLHTTSAYGLFAIAQQLRDDSVYWIIVCCAVGSSASLAQPCYTS